LLLLCGAFHFGYLLKVAQLFDADAAVHNNKKIAAKHQRGATDFAEHLYVKRVAIFISNGTAGRTWILCPRSGNFPLCRHSVVKRKIKII
jgi:hypothetical protein